MEFGWFFNQILNRHINRKIFKVIKVIRYSSSIRLKFLGQQDTYNLKGIISSMYAQISKIKLDPQQFCLSFPSLMVTFWSCETTSIPAIMDLVWMVYLQTNALSDEGALINEVHCLDCVMQMRLFSFIRSDANEAIYIHLQSCNHSKDMYSIISVTVRKC